MPALGHLLHPEIRISHQVERDHDNMARDSAGLALVLEVEGLQRVVGSVPNGPASQ